MYVMVVTVLASELGPLSLHFDILHLYRIKFDEESPTSQIYYSGDKQLPIFSKVTSGYGFDQLIEILMTLNVDKSKICTVRPTGVSENATFVVNLDVVRFGDLKSDDLGSWNATRTKSTYFHMTDTCLLYTSPSPRDATLSRMPSSA